MDDERPSLRSLARQIERHDVTIEQIVKRDIEADITHRQLLTNDGETAQAVRALTLTLNDPRSGLIVELDRFRAEVVADRKAFRAWVRGATFVVSVIFATFTIISPWIRQIIEAVFAVRPPGA